MSKATLDQASKILDLCRDLKISSSALQAAIDTGALTDVLTSPNLRSMDREAHRRLLGHQPLVSKPTTHVIDLGAEPFVPDGWRVESHERGGKFAWDASKVQLHLDSAQDNGGSIEGNKLRKKLTKVDGILLNANVLDYLLAHPELIPESWKGKAIFFWGTIYRGSSVGLYVRCLCWGGERWCWSSCWLGGGWGDGDPAAVLRECEV